MNIPASFSLVFLDFQLAEFDRKFSFSRYHSFHGYFVVSSAYLRFRILLMVQFYIERTISAARMKIVSQLLAVATFTMTDLEL